MSEWTVDTLRDHILALLADRDVRYVERFMLAEKAVDASLAASEKAVTKAEIATEKRFDSVNEFRAQLADQAGAFMPRKEFDVQMAALSARISQLERSERTGSGHSAGLRDGWGYLVGAAGTISAVVTLVLYAVKR